MRALRRALRRWRRPGRDYDVVIYMPSAGTIFAQGDATGGAETQTYLLTLALAELGRRVAVVVDPRPDLPRSVNGVDLIQRPRSLRHLRGVGKVLETGAILWTLARLNSAALVQRAAGFATFGVGLAAKLSGARFAYASANVSDFEFERRESRRRNVALFELGVRMADLVVVQTREQSELCVRRFDRHPIIVKSVSEPVPARTKAGTAFLWIGRLAFHKQPFALVELARELPEIPFEMVALVKGEAGLAFLDDIRSAAGTLDNLTVFDARPRDEVMCMMESAVAILNTATHEGMPNVFLEGWTRGVPAVALHHDPDGVIEREGLGGFAHGSTREMRKLVKEMWAGRRDQREVATRCRNYIMREHAPEAVARAWGDALQLGRAGSLEPSRPLKARG